MEERISPRQRRSRSESDQERGSASSTGDPPATPLSPGLMSEFNLNRCNSNPDLVYLRENLLESPMGQGLGTRLQARQSDTMSSKLARTLQRVEYLKIDIEGWATWTVETPPHRISKALYVNYDQLQARRKVIAKEALLRGADMRIIREIEGLSTRLDNLKRLAEKRAERSEQEGLIDHPQSKDRTEDEVFAEDEIPEEGSISLRIGNSEPIEPEPEKDQADPEGQGERVGEASRNTRDEAISQIITTIRQASTSLSIVEEDQRPRALSFSTGNGTQDKSREQEPRLSGVEGRLSTMERKVNSIAIQVTEIQESIHQVQTTQREAEARLSRVETRIDLIDRNLKSYVHQKIAPVKQKVALLQQDKSSIQVTRQIQDTIKSKVEGYCEELGLPELRKEIVELREQSSADERTVGNLRDLVVEVRDQVIRNPLSTNVSRAIHTSTPYPPDPAQTSRECEVIRNNIERSVRLIRQLTSTRVTISSDVGLIKKCNKEDTGKINRHVKTCSDDLLKYIKYPEADEGFCSDVRLVLDAADDWVVNVESVYARSEAHAISDSRGDISRLGIFNNNAEKTVFEFIEEADLAMLGWGTSKQRASLLIKHLSEEIKSRVADFSDNFGRIREWLIKTYGGPERIIGDILARLRSQPRPSNPVAITPGDKGERYSYFAAIASAVGRIDKLGKLPDINSVHLTSVMYCRNTISGLIELLPHQDQDQLQRKMTERNLDWDNPQGESTYALFKEYCTTERNIVATYRGIDNKSRNKPKSVFISNTEKEANSDEDDLKEVHTATYVPPAPWYPPGMRFPCPLSSHNHEMAECKEWLSMTPTERWENTKVRRICYACLRPKSVCNERKCKFSKSIDQLITCQGCVEYATANGWAPFSILMCRKRKHAEVRAKYTDIKRTLDKYLGKMSSDINESNLKVSANFARQVHTAAPVNDSRLGGSSDKDKPLSKETPCIDTQSGTRVYPTLELIEPEINQHAHYLMQILQIGESQVLTFYDTGANSHLISGAMAEEERLERYSSKPTRITVVGGGSVCSEYGSYKFCLGPDPENKFHELKCIGMEDLTSEFRKYDLNEIKREYLAELNSNEEGEVLPEYVGGSKVKLLIGIKNTNIVPVLIKTLNSGVGVYRSPFRDIFGSRIIFAGPHAAFTQGNRGIKEEISHAVFHIQTRRRGVQDGTQLPFHIIGDKRTGAGVYPTPLSRIDFEQLGCNPEKEPEEYLSQANPTGLEAHVCRIKGDQVPIARMRELLDQDNPEGLISFRCTTCSACVTCRKSPRTNAISLQESREQDVIEKSVTVNLEERKVHVKLPFMVDPIPVLRKKHGAANNYKQASSVYRAQCRKPARMKEGMRKVHADLVEKGFMMRLTDMSPGVQEIINKAEFVHYYPWNIVENEGSISTPMRLVVDPSMTGLNQTLAKGENTMGNIFTILVRCLSQRFAWASDISKLYNQLRLEPSALPFSLFLYHDSLDQETDPEIWLMVRAWYGVTPTGSQAGFALEWLAKAAAKEFPQGSECILNNRYVDDIPSGAGTVTARETQIHQVERILEKGGFSLKYIVRSGEDPDPKATSDGVTTKLLGYKWETKEDVLRLGFTELNLNRKVRGAKKPNEFPVSSTQDAEKLLQPLQITRRQVISKIAEVFDPVGLWEPVKLNLKLEAAELNGMEWDKPLPEDQQGIWKNKLVEFLSYGDLTARRCGVPTDEESTTKIRLIVLSDAAESAGGAAVYAGRKMLSGVWSCSLMAAKSRMMKFTIPRNELSAILLATELAFLVKKALGDRVDEIIYVTDSTIALSWCHNTTRKLRAFIFARVESIRRMIQWTTEKEQIPLYHVDGTRNLADLLTKRHSIRVDQVSIGSTWQEGEPWMKVDFNDMGLTSYEMLSLDKQSQEEILTECFSEPNLPEYENVEINFAFENPGCCAAIAGRGWEDLILDPIRLGWRKTLRILNIVIKFIKVLKHETFHEQVDQTCTVCRNQERADPRLNHQESKDILFRFESKRVESSLSPKELSKFKWKEGILYFQSRIAKENPFKFKDLDMNPFLDKHELKPYLPVMMKDSPVLYSLIISIHCRSTPHVGIERTVREVFKEVFVVGGLRDLLRKIKAGCITCKRLDRTRVELSMDYHPAARTTIAPPFYCSMIDIAYGFAGRAYKRSRTRTKIYALVFCCILSGATNILALEGIETSDVVQAIERHSSRHGVPNELYVDNGSQLKTLENASFSVRDVDARVYDALGIKVYVSNAKAHEERGRVERKIRSLRETLQRLGVKATDPLTALQWESVFARIASTLDDMPLAKGKPSSASNLGYEIISANRLKLGRNNYRSLEGAGISIEKTPHLGRMLERNREIYKVWYSMFMENIHELMVKPDKWDISGVQPKEEDIVMFIFTDSGHSKEEITWKLGRVTKVMPRKVTIEYVSKVSIQGKSTLSQVSRNPRDISILFSVDQLFINTNDHFKALFNHE